MHDKTADLENYKYKLPLDESQLDSYKDLDKFFGKLQSELEKGMGLKKN